MSYAALTQRDEAAFRPEVTVIERMDEGLWTLEGDPVRMLTIPFTTRMTVVRLTDGGLWLHSPVAATDSRVDAVSALGPVRHVVAPNKFHHLFVTSWLDRFPDATSWAEPGLARRRGDIRFDHELGDKAEPVWEADLDQILSRGSRVLNEAIFHHRASRTLIFTDLIQNHDPEQDGGFWRWVKRANRILAPHGEAPRDWRLTVWDRAAARSSLQRMLAWEFDRVVLSHGVCVERGGRAFVERAFRWLQP